MSTWRPQLRSPEIQCRSLAGQLQQRRKILELQAEIFENMPISTTSDACAGSSVEDMTNGGSFENAPLSTTSDASGSRSYEGKASCGFFENSPSSLTTDASSSRTSGEEDEQHNVFENAPASTTSDASTRSRIDEGETCSLFENAQISSDVCHHRSLEGRASNNFEDTFENSPVRSPCFAENVERQYARGKPRYRFRGMPDSDPSSVNADVPSRSDIGNARCRTLSERHPLQTTISVDMQVGFQLGHPEVQMCPRSQAWHRQKQLRKHQARARAQSQPRWRPVGWTDHQSLRWWPAGATPPEKFGVDEKFPSQPALNSSRRHHTTLK